ncbi:MAG TPA: hypothetical protein PKZ27_14960 [Rhodocyclaceae bacterium]|nr:hypothetical protein [Rhodocyclaceae bacterium]
MMFGFVDVKERLPDEGQRCEVLREVCYYGPTGYCRFLVESTTYHGHGAFLCDIASTGIVRAWRPAEGMDQPAAASDYAALDALADEASNKN